MLGWPDHGEFCGEHLISSSETDGILVGREWEMEGLNCAGHKCSRNKVCGGPVGRGKKFGSAGG